MFEAIKSFFKKEDKLVSITKDELSIKQLAAFFTHELNIPMYIGPLSIEGSADGTDDKIWGAFVDASLYKDVVKYKNVLHFDPKENGEIEFHLEDGSHRYIPTTEHLNTIKREMFRTISPKKLMDIVSTQKKKDIKKVFRNKGYNL